MIRIIEVGPRDGLQNESALIETATKVEFVDALSTSGVTEVEVSAFVSPKWIPQLADADEVFTKIKRIPGVTYSALVPNDRGMERAVAAKVDKIAVFTAASESFNQKNINTSIAGSIERFTSVVKQAHTHGMQVRGYISTAFWCPYEGQIEPKRVVDVALRLLDVGATEISIGDTIGKAVTGEVRALLDVLLKVMPVEQLALHFHDTYGRASTNVIAAWEAGIRAFDSSVGGLGGCPYAPGAPGNVATATVVRTLRGLGADVSVDLKALEHAQRIVSHHVSKRDS